MIVSSRRGRWLWRGGCEGPAVAQQGPEHVDQASGQGEQGLAVDESFASFAVVEDAGRAAGLDAGQGSHVEHAAQSAVPRAVGQAPSSLADGAFCRLRPEPRSSTMPPHALSERSSGTARSNEE